MPCRLLGHSRVKTIASYVHLARDSVHQPAVRVADSITAETLTE